MHAGGLTALDVSQLRRVSIIDRSAVHSVNTFHCRVRPASRPSSPIYPLFIVRDTDGVPVVYDSRVSSSALSARFE